MYFVIGRSGILQRECLVGLPTCHFFFGSGCVGPRKSLAAFRPTPALASFARPPDGASGPTWFVVRLTRYAVAFPADSGSSRIRFPVAAKMALQTAGANGGTPGSPTPAGGASLSTI